MLAFMLFLFNLLSTYLPDINNHYLKAVIFIIMIKHKHKCFFLK